MVWLPLLSLSEVPHIFGLNIAGNAKFCRLKPAAQHRPKQHQRLSLALDWIACLDGLPLKSRNVEEQL